MALLQCIRHEQDNRALLPVSLGRRCDPCICKAYAVDLTRILRSLLHAALADMGAEVIKVEPPGGDPLRAQGVIVEGLSWYFAAFNRNKRSVVLNLRSAAGKAARCRLIATADVVVDNFRPGVMADLGLEWPQLAALRPGIIHTSVTGFGERGPCRPASV